jgi:hypothetical protein
LHFSHIGLTEGLTFISPSSRWSVERLWRPQEAAATAHGLKLPLRNPP